MNYKFIAGLLDPVHETAQRDPRDPRLLPPTHAMTLRKTQDPGLASAGTHRAASVALKPPTSDHRRPLRHHPTLRLQDPARTHAIDQRGAGPRGSGSQKALSRGKSLIVNITDVRVRKQQPAIREHYRSYSTTAHPSGSTVNQSPMASAKPWPSQNY